MSLETQPARIFLADGLYQDENGIYHNLTPIMMQALVKLATEGIIEDPEAPIKMRTNIYRLRRRLNNANIAITQHGQSNYSNPDIIEIWEDIEQIGETKRPIPIHGEHAPSDNTQPPVHPQRRQA